MAGFTVRVAGGGAEHLVLLYYEAYALDLRTTFGTSHSSTNQRSNCLLTCQIGETVGLLLMLNVRT